MLWKSKDDFLFFLSPPLSFSVYYFIFSSKTPSFAMLLFAIDRFARQKKRASLTTPSIYLFQFHLMPHVRAQSIRQEDTRLHQRLARKHHSVFLAAIKRHRIKPLQFDMRLFRVGLVLEHNRLHERGLFVFGHKRPRAHVVCVRVAQPVIVAIKHEWLHRLVCFDLRLDFLFFLVA